MKIAGALFLLVSVIATTPSSSSFLELLRTKTGGDDNVEHQDESESGYEDEDDFDLSEGNRPQDGSRSAAFAADVVPSGDGAANEVTGFDYEDLFQATLAEAVETDENLVSFDLAGLDWTEEVELLATTKMKKRTTTTDSSRREERHLLQRRLVKCKSKCSPQEIRKSPNVVQCLGIWYVTIFVFF